MPYNNTPITPSKEITGTVALPLARVKKIIAADDDIANCSNNAAFVITVATEMFLQHLVEQSYNIVKSERKPRRNIQYRDVASAVARVENLEFLTDVVPKTTTFKAHKQKVAGTAAAAPVAEELAHGQRTLTSEGQLGMAATEPMDEGEEAQEALETEVEAEEQQATNGAASAFHRSNSELEEPDQMDLDSRPYDYDNAHIQDHAPSPGRLNAELYE